MPHTFPVKSRLPLSGFRVKIGGSDFPAAASIPFYHTGVTRDAGEEEGEEVEEGGMEEEWDEYFKRVMEIIIDRIWELFFIRDEGKRNGQNYIANA